MGIQPSIVALEHGVVALVERQKAIESALKQADGLVAAMGAHVRNLQSRTLDTEDVAAASAVIALLADTARVLLQRVNDACLLLDVPAHGQFGPMPVLRRGGC